MRVSDAEQRRGNRSACGSAQQVAQDLIALRRAVRFDVAEHRSRKR
jgi:hypothetical protein